MNKFERLLSTIVVSPKFVDMLNVLRYLYLYTYAVYGPVRLTVFIMKSKNDSQCSTRNHWPRFNEINK